jgi:hypothetical protein
MSAPAVTMLILDAITVDPGISARTTPVSKEAVEDYAQVLRDGGEFPPCVVVRSADKTYLVEGHQRFHSYRLVGRSALPCIIVIGTYREAVLRAAGANLRGTLPRTPADKRLSVLRVLQDEEGRNWPSTRIMAHCGVGAALVSAIRALSKGGATPSQVAGHKFESKPDAHGMPQAPAEVFRPGPAPSPKPVAKTSPAPPPPAPRPSSPPAPKPSAPKPPPAGVNPWDGCLDAPKPSFVPSPKDVPPDEEDDDPEDDEDGYDAEEDDGEVLDGARLRERMLRAGRKFARYVSQSNMEPHAALDLVLEDMRVKAIVAARRGRPERPPRPDSTADPAGG